MNLTDNEKFAYKDLDIGQFFYDTNTNHYGIKISSCRAYNIDRRCMYGFAGNHANDSDYKHYLKCDYKARPQGYWLPNYTSQFFNPGRSCSICGKIVEFSENYCPQCGAKMRGDNNERY